MFINKIGFEHLENGMNCQDYGFEREHFSIVCDGCSEGRHSEVGAKLCCHLFKDSTMNVTTAFRKMIELLNDRHALKDYLCFTMLMLHKMRNCYVVGNCGDGYIILQDNEGNITFEKLSDGEYPKYYIYNYIDKEHLKHYKDGVSFSDKSYPTSEYEKVGIASDGLRYILQADEELKQEFIDCLKSGKELKVKLFINRHHRIFKDDVTIVF